MDDFNKMDLGCLKPNVRPSQKRKSIPGVSSTSVAFDEELCPTYTKPPAYTVGVDARH